MEEGLFPERLTAEKSKRRLASCVKTSDDEAKKQSVHACVRAFESESVTNAFGETKEMEERLSRKA